MFAAPTVFRMYGEEPLDYDYNPERQRRGGPGSYSWCLPVKSVRWGGAARREGFAARLTDSPQGPTIAVEIDTRHHTKGGRRGHRTGSKGRR